MISTTLPTQVLSKHLNSYFFETGTANGSCVALALSCGFEKVISIEIDADRQLKNCNMFKKEISEGKVELLTGDSLLVMKDVIGSINKPTTFWLDAHVDEGVSGIKKCPLYEELETISTNFIKTHTIMIDDISYFGTKNHWGEEISLETIKRKLLDINPSYKFSLENGNIPNDILVAYIN